MSKQKNKTNSPHVAVAQQPDASPVLSPQKTQAPMLASQQPKSLPQPGKQPIHDIPLPDPVKTVESIHDEIARLAYKIYVEEGCPQGQSDEIWRRAEIEQRYKNVAAPRAKLRG